MVGCLGVFPAYAGMFHSLPTLLIQRQRFPRIRGDVPAQHSSMMIRSPFSPHTRGCSPGCARSRSCLGVFPAYAGMFRLGRLPRATCTSFPRIRGDVPLARTLGVSTGRFSPHTRGCSGLLPLQAVHELVFPAYAGMFRSLTGQCCDVCGFPRIRGDVPIAAEKVESEPVFSPHTRGCSLITLVNWLAITVFPAYAGMFLASPPIWTPLERFPRIRGDVPHKILLHNQTSMFSPHTRGCSSCGQNPPCPGPVFPAYAGMFLRC